MLEIHYIAMRFSVGVGGWTTVTRIGNLMVGPPSIPIIGAGSHVLQGCMSHNYQPKDIVSCMESKRVVFIGDSNHAVSPFAGNGANMALMDGIDLATELCQAENLYAARASFDKRSMARSTRTVKSSHMVITIAHSSGWWLWFYKLFLHVLNLLMSF